MAYDGFFAGLSTRASVNEILNLAIKTKNEAEDIAERIKVSEQNALNSAIEAALQADRAQRIADSIDGSGTGGGADLKSIGIYSGIDYGVVGGATREESRNINKALKVCGEAGGGVVVIRSIVPTDPIFIDGPVQIEENNVTLYFDSPIRYGANGFIRVSGSFMEIRRPGQQQLIALDADSTVDEFGSLQFTVRAGDEAFLQVGDRLTLRGQNDITGNAIEKQTVTVAKIEGRVITTYDDPEYTFRRVYPNSDWEPDWTTGTTVSIVNYSAFTNFSTGPNVITAQVEDGTKFKKGDLLYVSDARLEKDIMSPEPATLKSAAVMEHVRVAKVEGNVITFDKPLVRQYLNQWKGGLSQLNPVVNSHIVVKDLAWSTPQSSRKNPALAINFGDKCTVKVDSMRGETGRIGTGIRVAYSYDCTVFNSQVKDAIRWDSAEAYGIVMYYSTYCRVKDCLSTGGRHNYLIQTCVSCDIIDNISTDDYISGIDLHGAGAINCTISGNRVTRSSGHTPDSVNGGGIRNGNTSHMIGDHGTLIANNVIEGYNDNAGACAIDVSPSSQNVVVRDNTIKDSSIGFRHYKVAERAIVVQHANRVILIGNTFERVAKLMDTQGHATSVIDELVLIDNKSINNASHFQIIGVPKVTLIDNQVIAPINTPGNYAFEVREATDLFATGNVAKDANRGFRIANCPNAKIIKNILDYTRDNFPFQDGGGNTGYIQKNNTLADSGGSGGATIQVGTVTTGEPGTDVIITNVGTTTDAIFDFTIPRGDPGADGGGGGGGANSQALDGLVGVNGGIPMFTGVGAMQRIPSGTVGRNILAAATVPEAKEQIGLANVDNTSDVLKPISTATQDALNLKAPLVSPILTGTPTTPHPLSTDDSRQIPTTNWVKARIAEIPTPPVSTGGRQRKTIAFLGDSVTGNAQSGAPVPTAGRMKANGYISWFDFFQRGRVYFPWKWNFGKGGDNSTDVLARVANVVAVKPDYCVVETGGVDGKLGYTVQQTIDNLTAIYDALSAAGVYIIGVTMYPNQGPTSYSRAHLAGVNAWVKQQVRRRQNFTVVDIAPYFTDFTNGAATDVPPAATSDGTHPGPNGSMILGKLMADAMEKLEPYFVSRENRDPNDVWNATSNPQGNILPNGCMQGTGGTLSTGVTGTLPATWEAGSTGGATAVASIEPHPEMPGLGKLVLDLGGTGASPTAQEFIYVRHFVDTKLNPSQANKKYEYSIEVEVENLTNITSISLEVADTSAITKSPNGSSLELAGLTTDPARIQSNFIQAKNWRGTLYVPPTMVTTGNAGVQFRVCIHTVGNVAYSGKVKLWGASARPTVSGVDENGAV